MLGGQDKDTLVIQAMLWALVATQPTSGSCPPPEWLFNRPPVAVRSLCAVRDGVFEFSIIITNTGDRPEVYIDGMSLSFRGLIQATDAPPGWEVERKARPTSDETEIIWRSKAPSSGVAFADSLAGFRVKVSGPDAGITCWRTYSTSAGETSTGGGISSCIS